MREISIGGVRVADDTPGYLVAEIGSNHQGSIDLCKAMMIEARLAGAQAAKLQKRDLATQRDRYPALYDGAYNSPHAFGPTYGEHRAVLEFNADQYRELFAFAQTIGLALFATAFDVPSVEFLAGFNPPAIKIASGGVVDRELIAAAVATGRPVIVSTGGATIEEIAQVASWVPAAQLVLLHCTAEYPCPREHLNLNVIPVLRAAHPEVVIGFSNHLARSGGIAEGVAFVLGARVFETHFTIGNTLQGSDQMMSAIPEAFKSIAGTVGPGALAALGDGVKRRYPEEVPALQKLGRPDLEVEE